MSSAGPEAIELCEMAGLHLDPEQQLVLTHALGERADGTWAAREVGVCESRQNGKGAIAEARELTGLFLLNERLIIYSAHLFDTSLEMFRRLLQRIEETPDFDRRVRRVSRAHGDEGIELKGGQRIRFRTRTKGGGRGFTGDCILLDEAQKLAEASHGALMPTVSARPNPQIWYEGTAVDQLVDDDGLVFSRVRARGIRGDDPQLAYFEWSAHLELAEVLQAPDDGDPDPLENPEHWLQANPALDKRITREHVALEFRSMDRRTFAVERLGLGDWPEPDGAARSVIAAKVWKALADPDSKAVDPVAFTYDVSPDRSRASIAAAGRREDGRLHLEVIENQPGTGWLEARLVQLNEKHRPFAVLCDGVGPAGSLIKPLQAAGVKVRSVTSGEHAEACGLFYDAVQQGTLRHLGTPELAAAIRGAAQRPLADRWAWNRKSSAVDITPLVAGTLAVWAVATSRSESMFVAFV